MHLPHACFKYKLAGIQLESEIWTMCCLSRSVEYSAAAKITSRGGVTSKSSKVKQYKSKYKIITRAFFQYLQTTNIVVVIYCSCRHSEIGIYIIIYSIKCDYINYSSTHNRLFQVQNVVNRHRLF